MCEEYESYAGRPVVGRQLSSAFVPSVLKSNVPLNNDDQAHRDLLRQKMENDLKNYHTKTD